MEKLWNWIRGVSKDAQMTPDDELYLNEMQALLERDVEFAKKPVVIDKSDRIMLSGFYVASDIPRLQIDYGITHVINMAHSDCGKKRAQEHQQHGVKYLGISAEDDEDYDILSHWSEVKNFLDKFYEEEKQPVGPIEDTDRAAPRGRLLIHCMAGINRSGAVAVAAVAYLEHVNILTAVEQVHRIRGPILSNYGFRRRLINWGKQHDCL